MRKLVNGSEVVPIRGAKESNTQTEATMNFSKLFTKSVLSSLFLSLALGLSACGQSNPNEPFPQCGNGTLEDGEQCDDGDTQSGDGCSEECELEDECGDDTLNAGEQCDDGNTQSGDGCNASCEIEGPSEAEQIDEYVQALDPVPAEVSPDAINSETPAQETEDGNYSCSTVNLTKTVPLTSVSILADPTSSLFPGDILRGDSLYNGTFSSSGIDRKAMTYSLSVQDGTSAPRSATMQEPSLSAFRDTIGGILAQANLGAVPVKALANIQEIRSEEELNLALAVDVDTAQVDVKSQFNFGSQRKQSQFLVTIDIAYFTADIDANLKPSDFFADSVTLEQVQQEFNDENPPVYVSSITYGTRYYLAIESDFSSEELNAALQASFKGATTQVDGSVTLSTSEVIQNSNIKFVTVGATPQQITNFNAVIAAADPFEAIKEFMSNGDNFSAANIGAPLTFTMRHLSDNSITALAFGGTFDVQTCERISQNIQTTLKKISVSGANDSGVGEDNGTIELYGKIFATGLAQQTLFNLPNGQFVTVSNGSPFVGNGAQFQKTVHIDPRDAAAKVTLVADFIEDDGNTGDDDLPFTSLVVNKDSDASDASGALVGKGFSGQYNIFIPTGEGNLTVTLELKPIP
jgi:cysteine-rich repeat protein